MSSYGDGSFRGELLLYRADVRGDKTNTLYPHACTIRTLEDLRQVVAYDYTSGLFKDFRRKNVSFISAACAIFDVDNNHTNDSGAWITPKGIKNALPGVTFAVHYSRNHLKGKAGKTPRPKFHVIMPLSSPITNARAYSTLMRKIKALFPFIDENALDAARFFFGTENAQVERHEGMWTIDQYLDAHPEIEPWQKASNRQLAGLIPIGERNNALYDFALSMLTRYGDEDDHARQAFEERAACCEESLPENEISTIWNSALHTYRNRIKISPDYLPPREYALRGFIDDLLPADKSDLGQMRVFIDQYGSIVRYCPALGWLVYDGTHWMKNDLYLQRFVQELTDKQLDVIHRRMRQARIDEQKAEELGDGDALASAVKELKDLKDWKKFILAMRQSSRIAAVMRESAAVVSIDVNDLDRNPFLLNTPAGIIDLNTGIERPSSSSDYITKITTVSPSNENARTWEKFLQNVTCGEVALADYIQQIAGMVLIGRVYEEKLIIAYGDGGNGKSTLFNVWHMILGDYAGMISSDALTMGSRRNIMHELAELRGVRFVIAAETEEGKRFDTSVLKQIFSTDRIFAERKYCDPFYFNPSYTTVVYTNHLPRIGSNDAGTWDRLIVIPFNARFRGDSNEVKNYAQYLYESCGGAILQWMIEGAKKFIAADFKLSPPAAVRDAIAEYERANDWLADFIDESCEIGAYTEKSGRLYDAYRQRCGRTGEYIRHTSDFKTALARRGFESKRAASGVIIRGLRLKNFGVYSSSGVGGDEG